MGSYQQLFIHVADGIAQQDPSAERERRRFVEYIEIADVESSKMKPWIFALGSGLKKLAGQWQQEAEPAKTESKESKEIPIAHQANALFKTLKKSLEGLNALQGDEIDWESTHENLLAQLNKTVVFLTRHNAHFGDLDGPATAGITSLDRYLKSNKATIKRYCLTKQGVPHSSLSAETLAFFELISALPSVTPAEQKQEPSEEEKAQLSQEYFSTELSLREKQFQDLLKGETSFLSSEAYRSAKNYLSQALKQVQQCTQRSLVAVSSADADELGIKLRAKTYYDMFDLALKRVGLLREIIGESEQDSLSAENIPKLWMDRLGRIEKIKVYFKQIEVINRALYIRASLQTLDQRSLEDNAADNESLQTAKAFARTKFTELEQFLTTVCGDETELTEIIKLENNLRNALAIVVAEGGMISAAKPIKVENKSLQPRNLFEDHDDLEDEKQSSPPQRENKREVSDEKAGPLISPLQPSLSGLLNTNQAETLVAFVRAELKQGHIESEFSESNSKTQNWNKNFLQFPRRVNKLVALIKASPTSTKADIDALIALLQEARSQIQDRDSTVLKIKGIGPVRVYPYSKEGNIFLDKHKVFRVGLGSVCAALEILNHVKDLSQYTIEASGQKLAVLPYIIQHALLRFQSGIDQCKQLKGDKNQCKQAKHALVDLQTELVETLVSSGIFGSPKQAGSALAWVSSDLDGQKEAYCKIEGFSALTKPETKSASAAASALGDESISLMFAKEPKLPLADSLWYEEMTRFIAESGLSNPWKNYQQQSWYIAFKEKCCGSKGDRQWFDHLFAQRLNDIQSHASVSMIRDLPKRCQYI